MVRPLRRVPAAALGAALALGSVATHAAIIINPSDPRCASLPGPFPPGLDWIDAELGIGIVTTFEPAVAVPLDFGEQPPDSLASGSLFDLRSAIANAACGGSRDPQIDGVTVVSDELALLTGSACENVAFVDPLGPSLRSAAVSTPATLAPGTFPYLPAPGGSASRVAVSTRMCVSVPAGTLDSKGAPVAAGCRAPEPSYFTNFTSGAAVAAGRLFVSTSNLGAGAGTLNPQFLPGTVLVFDLAAAPLAVSPHPTTPVLPTTAFNPTHVTAYTTPSGRELVLVGASGALGLVSDDPSTPEREAGGNALSDAAIDVIDPQQLRLVASIPLGPAALSFERLGIDPDRRVALIGSAITRHVYAVDLAPLDALDPDADFVRLDGEAGPEAAIFDAETPLVVPGIANGAPPDTCPGFVVGVEFGSGRSAYASDFCDGTITRIRVDTLGAPVPVPRARFAVRAQLEVVAPVSPDSLGKPQAPGALRIFGAGDGPDRAAVLVGQPEGLACTVAVPAPSTGALHLASWLALTTLAVRRARRAVGAGRRRGTSRCSG